MASGTGGVLAAATEPELLVGKPVVIPASGTWSRFRRDRSAVLGVLIVAFLLLLAALGPELTPKSPIGIDTGRLLQGPGHAAWFGTDNLGRDIFSRVVAGARVSISLALLIGALMVTIGALVGATSGYFGAWVDSVAMRVVDVFLAFPSLILALAIAGTLGSGYRSVILALIATTWPIYARLIRGGVLAEREREYVDAVRGAGARPRRIVLRHILPNAASPILVLLSFDLGTLILFVATLGYLGVGIPPPTPEWGTMVSDGKNFIFTAPQMVIFPGLAVALAVIGFNLLGDGLRNALDPRQEARRRHRGGIAALGQATQWCRRRAGKDGASAAEPASVTATAAGASSQSPKNHGQPIVLSVDGLRVRLARAQGLLEPVNDVSLAVRAGETVGLVGESGCGKTMTALAIVRLLPPGGAITDGAIQLSGHEITDLSETDLRRLRGRRVGMVFQDPMTSLNPTMTIGKQIADPVRFHLGVSKAQARARAKEVLALVGMPRPEERLRDYPHQLSGGQRQRVMIAMALACEPALLIADEPTTALDVSIQDQILTLLDDLKSGLHMGLLLITHDMGVISRMADRVLVMYGGRIVETAPTADLFAATKHPYTEALLESIPRLDQDRSQPLYSIPGRPPELTGGRASCPFAPRCRYATDRCRTEDPVLLEGEGGHRFACFHPVSAPLSRVTRAVAVAPPTAAGADAAIGRPPPLLVVDDVVKQFAARGGRFGAAGRAVHAVSGVSFSVAKGETFGLVGESGCGKTTIGRLITALEQPDAGSVRLAGREVTAMSGAELRAARRDFQLVFQDPHASLDPRLRIGSTLREPMAIHHMATAADRDARIQQLLHEVGLEAGSVDRYPHEFSGGERQRIGFARVLTLRPSLIVADEPVSSLDVSIRSQILNLMRRLQRDHDLTYVLISHDLSVVRYLADRVGVMYLGKLVEVGASDDIYRHPRHPYTSGLLAAIPLPDPNLARRGRGAAMQGEPASATDPPSGCRFRTRCPLAQAVCAEEEPILRSPDGAGQQVACHFPLTPSTGRAGGGGRESNPPDRDHLSQPL